MKKILQISLFSLSILQIQYIVCSQLPENTNNFVAVSPVTRTPLPIDELGTPYPMPELPIQTPEKKWRSKWPTESYTSFIISLIQEGSFENAYNDPESGISGRNTNALKELCKTLLLNNDSRNAARREQLKKQRKETLTDVQAMFILLNTINSVRKTNDAQIDQKALVDVKDALLQQEEHERKLLLTGMREAHARRIMWQKLREALNTNRLVGFDFSADAKDALFRDYICAITATGEPAVKTDIVEPKPKTDLTEPASRTATRITLTGLQAKANAAISTSNTQPTNPTLDTKK